MSMFPGAPQFQMDYALELPDRLNKLYWYQKNPSDNLGEILR